MITAGSGAIIVYTVHKPWHIKWTLSTYDSRMIDQGTKPATRSTYRHGDLRRALLEAGIALAQAGGPDAVLLREATRRAGVVPNAAYRHFASRLELVRAVRIAALSRLAPSWRGPACAPSASAICISL